MPDEKPCPLCGRLGERSFIVEHALAAAIRDAYPVSPGHILIVPRRHEGDFQRLTDDERGAIFSLVKPVCSYLEGQFSPQGYNVGMNVGEAAGQTVAHVHLHVIPRYRGDVEDPKGGVRWVLPKKAKYW